jgi:hypothetical protein
MFPDRLSVCKKDAPAMDFKANRPQQVTNNAGVRVATATAKAVTAPMSAFL